MGARGYTRRVWALPRKPGDCVAVAESLLAGVGQNWEHLNPPQAEGDVLPRIRPEKNQTKEQSSLIMRPKKVILCVDDNEQELSVLKFILQTNRYEVVAARSGQEAIALFASVAQVDLALIDSQMPQMSGSQLAERLKRMTNHLPTILLGEAPAGAGEIHAADALMVRKNCSVQDLLGRIKEMSTRKRGPRKGAPRMTHAVEEELAAAS
jgi:two-component system, OmpR family, response regulator CpxR